MMSINAHSLAPKDSFSTFDDPYTYGAEHAITTKEPSLEELEAAVKESPPPSARGTGFPRSPSSARAFGDVMDESEKMLPHGSPGLRHKKGRLEHTPSKGGEESYAEVVKHEAPEAEQDADQSIIANENNQTSERLGQGGLSIVPKQSNGVTGKTEKHDRSDGNKETSKSENHNKTNGDNHHESYAEIVKHEPTSPAILPSDQEKQLSNSEDKTTQDPPPRSVKRPSPQASESTTAPLKQALNEAATLPAAVAQPSNEELADPQSGKLVYENISSRSGTNLASIVPSTGFDLALSQRENKEVSSEPPSEKENTSQKSRRRLTSGRQAGAGWSQSAIRWAPLNIPVQRRLQTLAVFLHSMSIPGMLALFFILCTIPLFWPIAIPYLIYVLLSTASTDGKLAHRSEYIRRSKLWSLFASYFPARLHRTVELEPTRKYIFGYHPHGIISHGAFAAFATEALGFGQLFPGITNTLLTLDTNFRTPIYRDWALRVGLASVSRESCENLLTRGGPNGEGMGRAITIVVGGARESLDAKPGTLNLVLAKRKGFVKLAVRTGADLVPVLGFGENDMYDQINSDAHPWIHKGQLFIKKFMGFTVPLFHARGIFNYDVGIMPYRRPVNIVVGRPISTIQSKKPDPEYVNKLHKEYTDELLHMWEEWKDTFAADRKAELEIVE